MQRDDEPTETMIEAELADEIAEGRRRAGEDATPAEQNAWSARRLIQYLRDRGWRRPGE